MTVKRTTIIISGTCFRENNIKYNCTKKQRTILKSAVLKTCIYLPVDNCQPTERKWLLKKIVEILSLEDIVTRGWTTIMNVDKILIH